MKSRKIQFKSQKSEKAVCRDQRAVFFAPRAFGRPFPPLDHARSASQTARSSRAIIRKMPHEQGASVCGSAAGVALRLRFAMRSSPPSAPLSPLADPRPKPGVRNADEAMNSPAGHWKIGGHSAGRQDSAMKVGLIVWRRRARQGYYGSDRLGAPASVPPLTRPPPPGSLASRFSSREAVAVRLRETFSTQAS